MTGLPKLWIQSKMSNPRAIVRDWDYRDLGKLSETHASLPRRYVKQIIHNRRTEAMMKAAKREGKEVTKCEICSRIYLVEKGHKCFITTWGSKISTAKLPSTSNIIISQDGKHEIKISRRKMVDPDKIAKEYERLQQYRTMVSGKNIDGTATSTKGVRDGVESSHTPLLASEKEWAIPDLPSMDDRMNEQPDINAVSIEPTELYQLIKRAIWEVCDSHFRDNLPPRRIK